MSKSRIWTPEGRLDHFLILDVVSRSRARTYAFGKEATLAQVIKKYMELKLKLIFRRKR